MDRFIIAYQVSGREVLNVIQKSRRYFCEEVVLGLFLFVVIILSIFHYFLEGQLEDRAGLRVHSECRGRDSLSLRSLPAYPWFCFILNSKEPGPDLPGPHQAFYLPKYRCL